MYGKVFKQQTNKLMEIYASFGGLLMCLKGDPADLDKLTVDKRIYLLIKKIV